jgi:sterol O-acyltransferase
MRVQIWQLFTVKVWELALADGLMVLSTAASLPLHRLFRSQIGNMLGLRWQGGGKALQSVFQTIWFGFWVAWVLLAGPTVQNLTL